MKIREYVLSMLSEPDGRSVSFARNACLMLLFYFMCQDSWFYHKTGHLIDNKTALIQLGWCATYYATNKIKLLFSPDRHDDKHDEDKHDDKG
jgi:hypothetical protein